jgi:type VI secretion system protein ImpK
MADRQDDDDREEQDHEDAAVLSELCTDFFLLGLQIRSAQIELPACETLRRRVLQLFESMKTKANRAGMIAADVDDARYALAAYLDEMIHYSDWSGKEEWASSPLQAILFSESKAGERFFVKLQEVRKRSPAALEIYYTCLVLGFQGEYRINNPAELDDLIDEVRRDLVRGSGKIISVHGKPPETAGLGGKNLPLIPMAAGFVVLAVLVIAALYLVLASSQKDAVELLQQIGRG